jgi:hypothetical protein
MTPTWVHPGYEADALYGDEDLATEEDLDELEVGSVVVSYHGEGVAWIKVDPNGYVSVLRQETYHLSKRCKTPFMIHSRVVIVWQAPRRDDDGDLPPAGA